MNSSSISSVDMEAWCVCGYRRKNHAGDLSCPQTYPHHFIFSVGFNQAEELHKQWKIRRTTQ